MREIFHGRICFEGISYCPKPMAVTPYPHPKITNAIVPGAGPELGFGFPPRPVFTPSSLSSMASPSTLSNALLPSRSDLFFLKPGLTRRRPAAFSARPTHLRIYSSPFRIAAAAEEQPTSSGV